MRLAFGFVVVAAGHRWVVQLTGCITLTCVIAQSAKGKALIMAGSPGMTERSKPKAMVRLMPACA